MSPKERWFRIGYIVAGPLMNLLLAVGFYILEFQYKVDWFRNVSDLNLGLGILNLFPIYPLDGGQILFMLGSAKFPRKILTAFLGIFSLVVAVLLVVYQFTHLLESNILTKISSCCGMFLAFGIRTLKESRKTDEEYRAEIETAIRRERKIARLTE
jgi:Zn-dependent protease